MPSTAAASVLDTSLPVAVRAAGPLGALLVVLVAACAIGLSLTRRFSETTVAVVEGAVVATLVVLYAHAGSVLARANRDHDPDQLTIGAVLFVAATAVAYFKLTWGFMDKSLFFLVGGILLLALSWYLRRRNAHA